MRIWVVKFICTGHWASNGENSNKIFWNGALIKILNYSRRNAQNKMYMCYLFVICTWWLLCSRRTYKDHYKRYKMIMTKDPK